MVYGHKGANTPGGKAASCAGVELLAPIGTAAFKGFDQTLDRFKPTGYTPLAASLRKARDAFAGKEDAINRIILVTDGVETCGGDPVAEARKLKQAGIKVTTDVVGFDVSNPDEASRLRAIAEASGGTYTDARTSDALDNYFQQARDHAEELAKQFLCVIDNAGKVSLCQQDTVGKGVLYMERASGDAARAGRDAQAAEIRRLSGELHDAGIKRTEALAQQNAATQARLQRELDDANRRVEQLNK
jgi:hypothetical protein